MNLNRTIQELKLQELQPFEETEADLNRTIQELKYASLALCDASDAILIAPYRN